MDSILSMLQVVHQHRLIIMDTLSRMLCGQLFKFTKDCAPRSFRVLSFVLIFRQELSLGIALGNSSSTLHLSFETFRWERLLDGVVVCIGHIKHLVEALSLGICRFRSRH